MRLVTPIHKTVSGTISQTSWGISRTTLETLALFSILILGAILRYWHITVGLPGLYEHDEIFEVHRALELLRGEYNFSRTKGMYYYFLSLLSGAYGALLVLQGHFSDFKSFISYSLVHPSDIILLSRLLCAALGTLSIFLIYRLGKQVFSVDSAGPLLVALAWATCGLATWVSKWGSIETTVIVFGILAFFPILHLFENRTRIIYILAGVLIACTTATKVYGALLIVPLVFAHIISHKRNTLRSVWSMKFHGKLVLAFVVCGISLLILNPALFVQWWEMGDGSTIIPKLSVDTKEVYPILFYFRVLRWNIGNIGIVFLLIGVVTAIMKFDKKICTCSIFAVSFFLALGLKKEAVFIFDRYILLSLPLFFVVAVYGFEMTRCRVQRMFAENRVKRMVMGTFAICTIFWITWNGVTPILANPIMDRNFVPVQQKALEWFEKNVPGGAIVVIRGETRPWPGNQNLPIFNLKENYLHQHVKKIQDGETAAESGYLLDLARADDLVRYNLVNETRYVMWKHPDEYIGENGAEYFVVDVEHFSKKFTSRRSVSATESRRKFYQSLRNSSGVALIKSFRGYNVTGIPRTLEIYRVVESTASLAPRLHD